MAIGKTDIRGSLILNLDQNDFKQDVDKAIKTLVKYTKNINENSKEHVPGYFYQDYVITIKVSHDKTSCSVYRNRTSVLVYAMVNGLVSSVNYEYIYVADHLKKILKEHNG